MGIMDMFRSMTSSNSGQMTQANQNVPANNQPQAQPLNQQTAPANGAANPADPNFGQAQPKEPKEPESPLETWKDLWSTDPKAEQPKSLSDFSFSVDQKKIAQAARGMDFTKAVTPEIMQAIQKGGPEAQAAMLTAMNTMSQEVMRNAILVSAGIVEGGIKSSGANVEKYLPDAVRKATISNALREDNPLFNDPATAPMLSLIEEQMTRKFPNATVDEIKQNARKYLLDFTKVASSTLTPDQNKQQQSSAQPVVSDFSSWEV